MAAGATGCDPVSVSAEHRPTDAALRLAYLTGGREATEHAAAELDRLQRELADLRVDLAAATTRARDMSSRLADIRWSLRPATGGLGPMPDDLEGRG
jgi:hypothetical protein